MFTKTHRLTESAAITKTLRTGQRVSTPGLAVVFRKVGTGMSKVAFVVGTKVDKRATVRNRLKRRTREALRPLVPSMALGFEIVVFPRLPIDTMVFADVKKLVADVMKRARLLV